MAVAESREEETREDVCPQCGSSETVQDDARGQVVCANCGRIIREKVKDRGPEWRSFNQEEKEERSRAGPPAKLSESDSDRTMSTQIGGNGRDAKGNLLSPGRKMDFGRLKKWHRRTKMEGKRNYAQSFISRVCSQARLPDNVEDRAKWVYRKASEAGIVQGRPSEDAAAAAIYLACVEAALPVSMDRIGEVADADERGMQKVHGEIVRELDVETLPISPVKYIPSMVKKIERTICAEPGLLWKVKMSARKIAERVEGNKVGQGRSRRSVAAAVICLAVRREIRIPMDQVASCLGVSESAIEGTAGDIKEELGEERFLQIINDYQGGEKK